jgi:pyridoxal 5'-phosphate synthase pdxT subunit
VRIGVLSVQGGFAVHMDHLESVGAIGVEVRKPADLREIDGLILPGGESTTISKGIESAGLADGIRSLHAEGRPILGTCAGMIVADREHLDLIDITTRRNAFGRQLASFEDEIDLPGITDLPVRAVFIRAPWVEQLGDSVEVLTEVRGHPVAVRQANVTALSFHPELVGDDRIHAWFARECGRQGI